MDVLRSKWLFVLRAVIHGEYGGGAEELDGEERRREYIELTSWEAELLILLFQTQSAKVEIVSLFPYKRLLPCSFQGV